MDIKADLTSTTGQRADTPLYQWMQWCYSLVTVKAQLHRVFLSLAINKVVMSYEFIFHCSVNQWQQSSPAEQMLSFLLKLQNKKNLNVSVMFFCSKWMHYNCETWINCTLQRIHQSYCCGISLYRYISAGFCGFWCCVQNYCCTLDSLLTIRNEPSKAVSHECGQMWDESSLVEHVISSLVHLSLLPGFSSLSVALRLRAHWVLLKSQINRFVQ